MSFRLVKAYALGFHACNVCTDFLVSDRRTRPFGDTGRPKVAGICRLFAKSRTCKYGQRCKFSHDGSSTNTKITKDIPPQRTEHDDKIFQFKRRVNQGGRADRFSGGTSTKGIFALGLEILDNAQDAGLKQEVISTLASEEGLSCICYLAATRIPLAMTGSTAAKLELWETEVCPLLRLVVHNTVVNSTLLEEKVATIHSFLIGVGASRMAAWFDLAVELAESALESSTVSRIGLAELSLQVLSILLDCGTTHIVNDSFGRYAERLSIAIADIEPSRPEDEFCKMQAVQYSNFIDRRLKVGQSIPGLNSTSASAVQLSAFQLQRDLPGHLSADGPRHDNDHADIAKICILPTPNEIRSTRSEYLPIADPSTWHHPGIRGRLDREFRLLREDTVGQLRDVVRTELEHLQKNADHGAAHTSRPSRAAKDSIQYCVYDNAIIMDVGFDRHTGAEFLVRFRQPAVGHALGKSKEDNAKSENQRREWWTFQAKKRLQPGGLVCSIDALGSVNFFTVTESTMRTGGDDDIKRSRRNKKDATHSNANGNADADAEIKYTLADDPKHAFVRLGFSDVESKTQLAQALSWYLRCRINFKADADARDGSQFRILVEFPGILLASFLHTLQALQAGTEKLNIPFSELLAPEEDEADRERGQYMTIPPPQYARKPGFVFDMRCLATDKDALEHSVGKPTTSQEVCERTKFDTTQSTAILEALSRSMALVQGPPGTGKTFAGVGILEVLLHNQKKADLGPIVIVCYTNHALDQLLEHIVDSGAAVNVLRMGGQSKSERLKSLNLRDAAMNMDRTKVEKHMLWEAGERLKESTKQLERLFDMLGRSTNGNAVVNRLRTHHNKAYTELFKPNGPHGGIDGDDYNDDDEDGFTTVIHGKPQDIIRRWRSGGGTGSGLPAAGTATSRGLFTLTKDERNAAYREWQTESFTSVQDDVEHFYDSYVAAKKFFDKTRKEVDLRCLKLANIVGMTTTGLAKNHDLLRHLNSKVLVCEEAGEVLEAHMLTSLLPSMQHAILIGDHQQLRPQVQNYDFSIESRRGAQFAFDTSLFERLVSPRAGEPRIPFSKLSTQRRMHPSISALIRAPLYPLLEDGPNVHLYPEVTGIQRRLFWLDHEHLEDGAVSGKKGVELSGTSKTNKFEVEMTAALVSHLFKQGTYSGGDIAVLTPYLGQMMLLRRRLSGMFELSFNDRDAADLEVADAVGFGTDLTATNIPTAPADKQIVPAKTTLLNSVRVATVDNFQGEEAKVIVISLVRSNNSRQCGFLRTSNRINVLLSRAKHGMYIIGNGDTCSGIPMWKDVVTALKAGDNMGPELLLQCPRHPEREFMASVPDHFVQFAPDGGCLQSCDKRLACGHSCTGRCHSDVIHAAVKCLEPCPRPLKGCTHECPRPCGDRCVERCHVKLKGAVLTLPCGHELKSPSCFETQNPYLVVCRVDVKRTVPGCKHELTLPCHKKTTGEDFVCTAVCGQARPCGHSCGRQCSHCNIRTEGKIARVNHGACRKACGRLYGTCQHACAAECHGGANCPPCTAPCDIRCSHSRCPRPCNEPCVPCAEEKCASSCPHSECTMPYVSSPCFLEYSQGFDYY